VLEKMELFKRFFNDDYEDEESYYEEEAPVAENNFTKKREPANNRVMSLVGKHDGQPLEKKIMLFEPRVFSDVKQISRRLINGEAALVNFQRMDDDSAHRVVDFLSGVVFAVDGEIRRVGETIFLCTSSSFTVEGDLTDFNQSRNNFD